MKEVKYCAICGKCIGNIYNTDYFSYIRLKYCNECKITQRRKQKAAYQKQYRKDGRKVRQLQKERIDLLETENELLRQTNELQREENRKLKEKLKNGG